MKNFFRAYGAAVGRALRSLGVAGLLLSTQSHAAQNYKDSTFSGYFRLPYVASTPSPLVNGQMWITSAGVFVRVNNANVGPLGTGGGGGGSYVFIAPLVDTSGTVTLSPATTGAAGSMSATDKSKLDGIATGATANSSDAALRARASHTGTQDADTITDGTVNKAFLATERTKLTGIATGATANSADAILLARANHTGTQAISTIASLQAALDAKVSFAELVALNASGVNTDGLVNWSQLVNVPAGFADGTDDGAGGGSGTVTTLSVTTANGVSGSVANPTTTPAITLTLGAITPASVAAVGSVTGSNLSGTNTGDQTSVTGNAGTATALQTARAINGVSFDGTASITVTAAAGTLTGATLASGVTASSLTSFGSDPLVLRPDAAQPADAVDITKQNGTKTYSGSVAWTRSATPVNGQRYGVIVTNSSGSTITITLWGACFSQLLQTTRSSFTIPAGYVIPIIFERRGSTDWIFNEPFTVADLSSVTVATTSALPVNVAGVDGKALVSELLALGITDTAYNASTWNGETTVAPSKNAVRDKIESLTTAEVAASANKNYVTDAQQTVIGNTSGTNTGDQTAASLGLGTSDSPQLDGVNVGHASDSTLTRVSAGVLAIEGNNIITTTAVGQKDIWIIPLLDETTALTTGTAKFTFRAPYACTVTAVRAALTTVSSSGTPTFDINEGGATILSTKLTVDASEKTSTTAASAAVISDSAIADDAEITIDIDTAGTGAAGAKIALYVTRT